MIQNIVKGRGFRGALDYALGKTGAERVGGNMAGRTARELAAEFRALRALRPDVERAVFHASLSAPPGEHLSNAQWETLAEAYAERMGFGASAYVVVRHHDQAHEHEHVHVIASRVDVHGRVVSDAHDRYRGQEVLRALEREHGLTRVAASWERKRGSQPQLTVWEVQQRRAELVRYEQTGKRPFSDLVREQASAAFEAARDWDELSESLGAAGLSLVPKRGGLALRDAATGESVKASAVGRECARSKLEQRFGVTYEQWTATRQQGQPVGDRQRGRGSKWEPDREPERVVEHAADGLPPTLGTSRDATELAATPGVDGADHPSRVERGGERGGRGGIGRDRAADRPSRGGAAGGAPSARGGARELGRALTRDPDGAGQRDGDHAGGDHGPDADGERAPGARERDSRADDRAPDGLHAGRQPARADELGDESDGRVVGVSGGADSGPLHAPVPERADVVGRAGSRATDGAAGGAAGGAGELDRSLRQLAERLGRELAEAAALAQERQRFAIALAEARARATAAAQARHDLEQTHTDAVHAAERGYQAQLGAVYRDPAAAHRAIGTCAQTAESDVVVAELRAAPERFGALQGSGAGDGFVRRFLGDDVPRTQARAAALGLAGWVAERHAAHAARRHAAPELARLAETATQAHDTAQALRVSHDALPHEDDRLRAIGREVLELEGVQESTGGGLVQPLAPVEVEQIEQLLGTASRRLLREARSLARDAMREREQERGHKREHGPEREQRRERSRRRGR